MKEIVLFASGKGSNALNVWHSQTHYNSFKIVKVFVNNPKSLLARSKEIPHSNIRVFNRQEWETGIILEELKRINPDYIFLLGFLWLVPPSFINYFKNRIYNIHPSLLPKYGGKGMFGHHVHRAVIQNKEKYSGISLHEVNERFDEGRVIKQARLPIGEINNSDDLQVEIKSLEHKMLPKWINELCS